MAHKKQRGGPVPPGNRSNFGPSGAKKPATEDEQTSAEKEPQEQDPKRRIGDFSGTAEHPYQQPGGLNDANH